MGRESKMSSATVRGGQSDFKWDKIDESEKDHYLGASSKQTTTRNGKDMLWYTKKKNDKLDKKKKKKIKKIEEELMKAELGIPSRIILDKELEANGNDYAGLGKHKK